MLKPENLQSTLETQASIEVYADDVDSLQTTRGYHPLHKHQELLKDASFQNINHHPRSQLLSVENNADIQDETQSYFKRQSNVVAVDHNNNSLLNETQPSDYERDNLKSQQTSIQYCKQNHHRAPNRDINSKQQLRYHMQRPSLSIMSENVSSNIMKPPIQNPHHQANNSLMMQVNIAGQDALVDAFSPKNPSLPFPSEDIYSSIKKHPQSYNQDTNNVTLQIEHDQMFFSNKKEINQMPVPPHQRQSYLQESQNQSIASAQMIEVDSLSQNLRKQQQQDVFDRDRTDRYQLQRNQDLLNRQEDQDVNLLSEESLPLQRLGMNAAPYVQPSSNQQNNVRCQSTLSRATADHQNKMDQRYQRQIFNRVATDTSDSCSLVNVGSRLSRPESAMQRGLNFSANLNQHNLYAKINQRQTLNSSDNQHFADNLRAQINQLGSGRQSLIEIQVEKEDEEESQQAITDSLLYQISSRQNSQRAQARLPVHTLSNMEAEESKRQNSSLDHYLKYSDTKADPTVDEIDSLKGKSNYAIGNRANDRGKVIITDNIQDCDSLQDDQELAQHQMAMENQSNYSRFNCQKFFQTVNQSNGNGLTSPQSKLNNSHIIGDSQGRSKEDILRLLKLKKHELEEKLTQLQGQSNALTSKLYDKRQQLEKSKFDLIRRKEEGEQRLDSLSKIQESLEDRLKEQMVDYNEIREQSETFMHSHLQPEKSQLAELKQEIDSLQSEKIKLELEIERKETKILELEERNGKLMKQLTNDEHLLAVINQEISNLVNESGEYLKIYLAIQEQKQKIAETQNVLDKQALEQELSQNQKRKILNNLNFLKEASNLVNSRDPCQGFQRNILSFRSQASQITFESEYSNQMRRKQIEQLEEKLSQFRIKELIIQEYQDLSKKIILERQISILNQKFQDIQNELILQQMMLTSIKGIAPSMRKVILEITRNIKLLKMKSTALEIKIQEMADEIESHNNSGIEMRTDDQIRNEIMLSQNQDFNCQEEQQCFNLFEQYFNCLKQGGESLNIVRVEYRYLHIQEPHLQQSLNLLDLHSQIIADQFTRFQNEQRGERLKLSQLQKVLPIVEQKMSHVLFNNYVQRHQFQIQSVIKTYGKSIWQKKKTEQLEEFHKINCQRLQKDYEIIDVLVNKKRDIIEKARNKIIKEKDEIINALQEARKDKISLIKKKEDIKNQIQDLEDEIQIQNEKIHEANSQKDNYLKTILDNQDLKYGIKEVYLKLREILQLQEESKNVIQQCDDQIKYIIQLEEQNIFEKDKSSDDLKWKYDRLQMIKQEIDLFIIKMQLGVYNSHSKSGIQNEEDCSNHQALLNVDIKSVINEDGNDRSINQYSVRNTLLNADNHFAPQNSIQSINKPLGLIYEFIDIQTNMEQELFKSLSQLLEGFSVKLLKDQVFRKGLNQAAKAQIQPRSLRISNDLSKIEFRQEDQLYRLDGYIKVENLKSIILTQNTKVLINKLNNKMNCSYMGERSKSCQLSRANGRYQSLSKKSYSNSRERDADKIWNIGSLKKFGSMVNNNFCLNKYQSNQRQSLLSPTSASTQGMAKMLTNNKMSQKYQKNYNSLLQKRNYSDNNLRQNQSFANHMQRQSTLDNLWNQKSMQNQPNLSVHFSDQNYQARLLDMQKSQLLNNSIIFDDEIGVSVSMTNQKPQHQMHCYDNNSINQSHSQMQQKITSKQSLGSKSQQRFIEDAYTLNERQEETQFDFIVISQDKELKVRLDSYEEFRRCFESIENLIKRKNDLKEMIDLGLIQSKFKVFKI